MNRFQICLAFTCGISIEGGIANAPGDHGGLTDNGLTQSTYSQYRASMGLPIQSVTMITQTDEQAIYLNGYWNDASCGSMPVPVDMCLFDTAVNSGPGRAALI